MSTMGYVTTLSGAEDAATLSLDFEALNFKINGVAKAINEVITTTRSTTAGRFNEKGFYETVPANTTRIGYDPVTKKCLGLLVEEARTNILTWSEDFNNSQWAKLNCTIYQSAAISPSGAFNASAVANTVPVGQSSGGAWCGVRRIPTGLVAGGVYTSSCYYKAGTRTTVMHVIYDTLDVFVVYDLSNGNLINTSGLKATDTHGIEAVGNGWYRVWITHTATSTDNFQLYFGRSQTTNTSPAFSTLYIWGAQLEAATLPAARPTTYIPTVVDFTGRASQASYYDLNGVMRTAPANIARSNTAKWVKGVPYPAGELRELAVTNQAAPSNTAAMYTTRDSYYSDVGELFVDGLSEFRKLTENTSNATHYALPPTFQTVANTYYAMSIFLKEAGRTKIGLYSHNGRDAWTTAPSILVDLKAKTVTAANCNATLEEMGGGVFRVTMVVLSSITPTATSMYPWLLGDDGASTYQGDGLSGVYLGGYQVEVGATSTSYINTPSNFASRTTTATMIDANGLVVTVPANTARNNAYKYDNTGKLRLVGQLLETASSNLLLRSAAMNTAPWTKEVTAGGVTPAVTEGSELAPDGTSSGSTITFTANTTSDASYLSQWFSSTTGATYTASMWIKAKSDKDVGKVLVIRHAGNNAFKTVTLKSTYQFVQTSEVADRTAGVVYLGLRPSAGSSSGTVECVVWGTQVELGAGATSYIPTTTAITTRSADLVTNSQVTRAADVTTSSNTTRAYEAVKVNDLNWYNMAASTIATEFTPGVPGIGNTSCALYLRSEVSAGRDAVGVRYQTGVRCVLTSPSGNTSLTLTGEVSVPPHRRIRSTLAYDMVSVSFAVNGNDIVTGASPSPSPAVMYLGSTGTSQQAVNGYLHKLLYYKTKLPDAMVSVSVG